MTLSDIKDNEKGYIIRVTGTPSFKLRLEELGFVPGQEVTRLYATPLGTPILYAMLGQQVALRSGEAQCVEVTTNPDEINLDLRETAAVYEIGAHPVRDAEGGTPDVSTPAPPLRDVQPHAAQCDPIHCASCSACHSQKPRPERREGDITIALVGNPNCGKTAFFNAASGGHERTGNYAGVTVSSVVGEADFEGHHLRIVDLPGTYSIRAFTPEEAYVASELARGEVDVVINVLDVNNLERNLLLTVQLQEMGVPMVGALNLYDEFEQSGSKLDRQKLAERLGMPLLPTVARSGRGVEDVLRAAVNVAASERVVYPALTSPYQPDHHALVHGLMADIYDLQPGRAARLTAKIDRYLAKSWGAFFAFALLMCLIFWATFTLGQYPMDWLETLVGYCSEVVADGMPEGWLRDLVADGIIGGVGSVIVFLPNILILYFFISYLEDSGYLARAALLFDPLLGRIGLHGKSFFPMLTGFGCNVPAVMATRIIDSRKARLVTMMVLPFMSCSARLPLYTIFAAAFFPQSPALVMSLLYFGGICVALLSACVLNRFFRRGERSHFVMEIPPYRRPVLGIVLSLTWQKGQQYLRKMGGIILVASIAVWALGYFPHNDALSPAEQQEQSLLGHLGHSLEPVIKPLGFDWRMGVGIIAGAGAKELTVSTLGVLYNIPQDDESGADDGETILTNTLANSMSPTTGLAYMVFALLYFPCFATLAVIRGETGRWRYALFTAAYTTALAYIAALVIACLGV